MKLRFLLMCAGAMALTMVAAGPAFAQSSGKWTGIGYLHVDGGMQTATRGFTSAVTFPLYGEDGTFTATYKFVTAGVFAARGGFRIGGNLGLGLGATRVNRAGEAVITAELPHPFHFDQPRSVSGSVTNLQREETMVSAELSWLLRPARTLDVMLFAGPAFFTTHQDMATMPRYTETYPFDTATLVGMDSRKVSKNGVGFTAGLDLSYLFSRNVGLGTLVRFSRAKATFSAAPGSDSSVTMGSFQASAGIRLRF